MLPAIMLLLALLVQPVCVFFTQTLMRHTAAECVRVLATSGDQAATRAYALRRLRAVPDASLFHVGGQRDWQVFAERSGDGKTGRVRIVGHVRPLPLFGVVVDLLGRRDDEGIVLEVEVGERIRPMWLGGTYEDWVASL
ncbi:MAG: pilus assembly protein [Atopobiaceae bacterium]|nr:pilus assembly protein [Atopobiaceae bacterium]